MTLDVGNRLLLATILVAAALTGLQSRPRPPVPDELVLPPVRPGEASRFSITDGLRRLRIVRPAAATPVELGDLAGTDAEWIVVSPGEARGPANTARVEAMLASWRTPLTSSVRAFPLATIDDLAALGFDRPDTLLLNIEREADDEIVSLEFGKPTRNGRFLRSEGLGPVYVVGTPGAEYLTADPAVWRDVSGTSAEARAVDRFGVRGPRGAVEFARGSDGDWQAVDAPDIAPPQDAIVGLLGDLVTIPTWGDPEVDTLGWPSSGPVVHAWFEAHGARRSFELVPVSDDDEQVPLWRSEGIPHREFDPALYANLARAPSAMGRPLVAFGDGPIALRFSTDRDTVHVTREDGRWAYQGAVEVGLGVLADALGALNGVVPSEFLPPTDAPPVTSLIIAVNQPGGDAMLEVDLAPRDGMHRVQAGGHTALLRADVVARWLALLPSHPPPPPN